MEVSFIYVTAADKSEATAIGKAMVERRLAAFANVIDGMNSIYWWKGKIEEATEAVLILKTQRPKVGALIAAVREVHSYECPCVVALPIQEGNPDYMDWIAASTEGEE